jgi:alkanesulfonate monooxygenase SsuD/methylene tetrahydromethanopterin reductase-like flavin-dependent oxidoreductase (luciferase family)
LRIAARYADIWNLAGGDVDTFQHKSRVLDEHCRAVDRDPSGIIRSVQLFVDQDDLPATAVQARSFIEAGAGHIVLGLRPPYEDGIVERIAREIAEPLLAAGAPSA